MAARPHDSPEQSLCSYSAWLVGAGRTSERRGGACQHLARLLQFPLATLALAALLPKFLHAALQRALHLCERVCLRLALAPQLLQLRLCARAVGLQLLQLRLELRHALAQHLALLLLLQQACIHVAFVLPHRRELAPRLR